MLREEKQLYLAVLSGFSAVGLYGQRAERPSDF
jgi:hypothetical protein